MMELAWLGEKPVIFHFQYSIFTASATGRWARNSGHCQGLWEDPALLHPGIRGLWPSALGLLLLWPSWASAQGTVLPRLLSSLVLGRVHGRPQDHTSCVLLCL